MDFAQRANSVFDRAVADYHATDDVDAPHPCPYPEGTPEAMLYDKCMVDAVQWHLEDDIRHPAIDPAEALALKRRIDRSNQVRTDMVEALDAHFRGLYGAVEPLPGATINTESPAWALDRLSILALKLWHMGQEARRQDATEDHRRRCAARLEVLTEQRRDLTEAIDTLLDDIAHGRRYMKVYLQMKMYNDADTNPVLRAAAAADSAAAPSAAAGA